MKRIIDIDEKDYEVIKRECSNKDVVPIGWVQILNGKPLQAEFEDIKAEINAKERVELSTKEMWYNFALADVTHIIDKHIAELKGENKKECSNCKSDNSHENCLGCIEYGHWELKGENNE